MAETKLTVHTFEMDGLKEAALKPLEEAAEVYGAWQRLESGVPVSRCGGDLPLGERLADELADVVQAACNLAERYHLDMGAAMRRCERRNRERGRYLDGGGRDGDA